MKRKLMFLALASIGLASCNGGFKKGDNGMMYKIVDDKSGASIKEGDFVIINFSLKNDADSMMQSSYENGQPQPLMMRKSQSKGDILQALSMLSEGDSAVVKVNIDSVSKGHQRPPNIKGKYLVYSLKVEKVIQKGNLSDVVFNGRVQDYMKKQADVNMKQEPIKIKKYITDKNLKTTVTASGLNYIITKQGSGPVPAAGDTAVVNYIGKFLNGKVFDTDIREEAIKAKLQMNPMNPYKPIRFAVGASGMIKGLGEGITFLNKGSKATFIIPSALAYGEQGGGPISPFTPLVFEIELVEIVHPNPNAPKPVAPSMPQAAQPVTK